MPRLRSALAVPLAVLLALAPAPLAHAEGSVPSEVRAYVADGSLVRQLNDVYGVDAAGDGIDFDDTTTVGTIERVHAWSAAVREGEETDHLVDILNEWVVPVSIAEEPVGLATVWINPANSRPELASFAEDADLAAALAAVPDGASLVRDVESSAWLALAPDGMLTALVPGSTGLSTPVPVDDVAILPAGGGAPEASGDPATGVGLALAVLLVLFAIIVAALVVPTIRSRRAKDADAGAEEPATEADAAPAVEAAAPPTVLEVAEEPPAEDPAAEPAAAAPASATPRKPRAKKPTPPVAEDPAPQETAPPEAAAEPPAEKPAAPARKPRPRTAKPPASDA